jgi:hypothetical protein
MADIQDVLAVTGEKVFLLLTGTEPVTGPVEVSFQHRTEGPDIITLDFWSENLVAEAADPSVPEQAGAVGRIPWTVNLNGVFTGPASPATSIIFFSISGKTASGKPLNVKAGNRLRLPAFKVTDNAKLRRIMTHEFHKADGKGGFTFDPVPVQAALDALTPQQRKVLATTEPGADGNRLVSFITLTKEDDRRMHADICKPDPFSIKPNATFATFHCQGPGKEVALVMFTRFFVYNMRNPETDNLVRRNQGKQKADDWLARANPTPPLFRIGCFARPGVTDGTLWNRAYDAAGKSVMGGNTMHGMINTVGCWMLFRNYNWPKLDGAGKPLEDDLDRVMNRFVRHLDVFGGKRVRAELFKTAYNDPDAITKFGVFDGNHAYAWFYREVVGVRYFSETMFKKNGANDLFAHQEIFSKALVSDAELQKFKQENGDGDFIYHSADDRLRKDKSFKVDDTLLGPNALGFQPCKRFCDAFSHDLKKAELPDRTWCNLHIYRSDDLKSKDFKIAFFAKI